MTNRRKNGFCNADVLGQSQSDDDLHLNSNSNLNDCNLLLNNTKNADNSLFDDPSLRTVSEKIV